MTDAPASRATYNELVQLLQRAGDEWVVAGPGMSDDDLAEGFRNLTHMLQSALYSHQEFDPERPGLQPHRVADPQLHRRQLRRRLLRDAGGARP